MLSTIVAAILPLLTELASLTTSSSTVGKIIDFLINLIPALVKEVEVLVPMVKNIIAALRGNGVVTPEQMAQLATLDADCDAALDAAAKDDNLV